MNKILTSIFITVLIFMLSINLYAQTTTGTAKAEIVETLTISELSTGSGTLDFGQLTVSSSEEGTCILSTSNVRTASGGVSVVTASSSSNADFSISGKEGASYAITLPSSDITLTLNGGSATMSVGSFTVQPASAGADQLTGTLDDTSGEDTFSVGGTLGVNAGQATGTYTGTFSITAAYN